ncbi:MAG: cupredoxin family copper-binding protein [Jatrophihabitantaceae bacterium]
MGLLAGCGGAKPGSHKSTGSTGGATTASSKAVTIDVKNFSFNPQTVSVATGTKVTWDFQDSVNHNVTANDKSFKSKDLGKGGSYSYTFNKAGSYSYLCTIHQYMTGTVTVK